MKRERSLIDELGSALPEPEAQEADELQAEIDQILVEARAHLGLSPDATREDIQEAFATRPWEWWLFFFAHYRMNEEGVEVENPEMHRELVESLADLVVDGRPGEEEARAYPREHAKSVFASLVIPTWAVLSGHRRFAMIFSDTSTQADEFLDDIRVEVETSERLQAIYPEACEWEREPRTNRLAFGNGAWIMAAGSGKSVRGARKGSQRPDLIILDDIENDEEVENPKRRKKKMRWYNRVVRKLGRAAVYIIVGTILHAESFLASRVKDEAMIHAAIVEWPERMDLWAQWEQVFHDRSQREPERAAFEFYLEHQPQMMRGARVLWPQRFTLYDLMVERAEDLASFLSERQNKPFDPSASWFPEDRIEWLDADTRAPDTDIVLSVAFWDPSRGTSRGDTSSLVRLDCYADGRRHVRESETDRVPPEMIMETGIGMHRRRRFDVWGVEKVGLSSYDEQLQDLAASHGLAIAVVPHTPTGNKDLRIRSLRPLVVSTTLTFDEALPLEAKRQLKFYPQHPNDDFPDAVHAANQIADEYLTDVEPAESSMDPTPEDLRPDRGSMFRGSSVPEPPTPPHHLGQRMGWRPSARA